MLDETRLLTREGIALAKQGHLEEAAQRFQEVLRRHPDFGHGYNNLANVFLFQGRYEEAIANYRRALEILPTDPEIHNHLSYAYSKNGSGIEAEAHARHALSLRPVYPEAYNHLGIALGLQERYREAEICYRECLRLRPGFVKAISNLAQLNFLERNLDEAALLAQEAIRLEPNQAEPYATLSGVYIRQRKYDEALAASRQAVQIDPGLAEANFNLATAYLEKGMVAQTRELCQNFLQRRPDYIETHIVLGMVALKEGKLDEALEAYGKVLAKKPNEPLVHFNRAVTWLLQGNFEKGWEEYEWRWRWKDFVVKPFEQPMWDGSALAGKSILLHAEQGMGDTLQFVRYASLVKKQAAKVIVACQPPLLKVLSRTPGIDELFPQDNFPGKADEHIPLLSLPHVLKTTLATIPADLPYIFADPERVAAWRETFAQDGGFKVGIAWQGSTSHPEDRYRSIPLADFAALGRVPGVKFFSLQKGAGREQLAGAPFEVVDLSPRLDDFADTAAALMHLDLVISADTALVHLAGAMNRPAWVALQYPPDFRWLMERDDSPWYPSLRLFRQNVRRQWREVFERMAEELTKLANP